MKYLQFQGKYKDEKIVAFIGENPPIEPIETKRIVQSRFEKTPEFQKHQELAEQKKNLMTEQIALIKAYNKHLNPLTGKFVGNRKEAEKIKIDYAKVGQKLENLESMIIDQSLKAEAIYKQIFVENAVYSTPRNAKLLKKGDLKRWNDLFQKAGKDHILTESGNMVSKIQVEIERISNLSDDKKEAEKNQLIGRATRQAMQMRNQLEIEGHTDALEKSQEWLKVEKEKIEEQYASS